MKHLYEKNTTKKHGFTLIELLLVIGIITILAAIVIVAINPAANIATAQNTAAQKQARELQNAIMQHVVEHGTAPNGITSTPKILCADSVSAPTGTCELVLKTSLTNTVDSEYNYISNIPRAANAERLGLPTEDSGFRISTDGVRYFVESIASTTMISSPPAIIRANVLYKNSSYAVTNNSDAIDSSRVLIKSGTSTSTMTIQNFSNYVHGINGIVFDIQSLPSSTLTVSDFAFKMSPTGLFNATTFPPSTWSAAPSPTQISVVPSGTPGVSRVYIEWNNNDILNRYLQIKVIANTNTGLSQNEVYYLGHLRGEINGSVVGGGLFVTTLDATAVLPLGTASSVTEFRDIDKSGIVDATDTALVSAAISSGTTLRVLTVPAAFSLLEG